MRLPVKLCLLLLGLLLVLNPGRSLWAGELDSTADSRSLIRIGVLQHGTVNWELAAMQLLGIDARFNLRLELLPLANVPATQIALKSGRVDMIVSDWLWVARQRQQGDPLQLLPYSRAIGRLLVAKDSSIQSLAELRGKRIGIAGGPLSKGWLLMQAAARQQGIDLRIESSPVFAAPPLLNAALEQGRIDALVTFWHYAARLQGNGYRVLADLQALATELGMASGMPMLGYVFRQSWAEQQPTVVHAFAQAIAATKQTLADQPQHWQPLRPLMNAENDVVFDSLRNGYVEGIPTPLTQQQIADAQRFYQLLHRLELARGWPAILDTDSFWGQP